MHRMVVAPLLVLLLLLTDSTAAASEAEKFKGIEPPEKGYVRLYVFRPAFSEDLRYENPLVVIDGTESFQLAYKSYTSLLLKSGAHEISTRPNVGESEIWNGRINVSLDENRVYFLAVWNDTTIGGGSLGAVTPYLGLLGVVIDRSENSTGVRFEFVTEKDATATLKDMAYVRNKAETGP